MGCDIHVFVEKKEDDSGFVWGLDASIESEWATEIRNSEDFEQETINISGCNEPVPVPQESIDVTRNYALFGVLADGVRWDSPIAFKQRGVPKDVSYSVEAANISWQGDGHSHSWVTTAELLEKRTELHLYPNEQHEYAIHGIDEILKALPPAENPHQQRIVFWFDN